MTSRLPACGRGHAYQRRARRCYNPWVNFFGHAVMAMERGKGHAFVVGSMLPDFASMLRAKVPTAESAEVTEGIAFHHATDEAFHGAPSFLRASSASFTWLTDAAMDRGSARAIAHVGVEILLDRTLALEADRRTGYLESLAHEVAFDATRWGKPEEAVRAAELRSALLRHGVDIHDCAEAVIAERLFRILARRPRLAFPREDLPKVQAWVAQMDPQVRDLASAILAEVRSGIP